MIVSWLRGWGLISVTDCSPLYNGHEWNYYRLVFFVVAHLMCYLLNIITRE